MTKFPIESGIPMPESSRGLRNCRYPFSELDVGQSFFIPGPQEDLIKIQRRVSSSIQYHQRKSRRTFATRTIRDDPSGIRVWRTS